MIHKTFEELRLTGQLPSPSGVGMEILRLTQRDDFSTEEIAQTISVDSALTGRLLKLANSAESGSIEPITTVNEATIRLGISTVRNLALGLSLVPSDRDHVCAAFDYDRYWSSSLARAVAAQRLSRELRIGVPAEMYILGLLCDVGSLALACVHPEKYGQLIEATNRFSLHELLEAEAEEFEIDHLEVSACMLTEWGLPDTSAEAVREYRFSDFTGERGELSRPSHLLQAADRIAQLCFADESMHISAWQELLTGMQALYRSTQFEHEHFEGVCDAIVREWREWGEVLKIPTPVPIRFGQIEERVAELLRNPPETAHGHKSTAGIRRRKASAARTGLSFPGTRKTPTAPGGLHILAVDDEPVGLKMLERHLVKAGHRVTVASDGDQALQLALEECPQLVVADWTIPGLDGVGLCRALRKISTGAKIYFLLLTGRGEEDSIIQAFEAGVDDYIVKPFKPKILLARIQAGSRIIRLQSQVEREQAKQKKQLAELQILTRKLRSAALTDPLTELPNRRYAMKRMTQTWESSTRTGAPMALIMMDIDHFKKVNDEYGHDAGDAVLKDTADCLAKACREDEDICRIGGEEFLVVCSNTDAEQALTAAERLREAVEKNLIHWNEFHRAVTLSLGVASRSPEMKNCDEMLKAADVAVYMAKKNGRNLVVPWDPDLQDRKSA